VIDAPKGTPWIEALCSFYAIFAKEDRIKLILYKNRGQDGVVVLEKRKDGALEEERFTGNLDAYDAFHSVQRRGFESQSPYAAYEPLAELFSRSGITPGEIHQAIH